MRTKTNSHLRPLAGLLLIALGLGWATAIHAGTRPTAKAPEPRQAERVALVIGNGNYPGNPLKNPVGDARAVATALTELGFKVDYRSNLDQKGLLQAVFDFYHHQAARSALRLVYYSGHGLQYDGHNYLLPVDANLGLPADIPRTSFQLDELRRGLDALSDGVSLIILDTCRLRLCPAGRCRGVMSSLGLGAEQRSSGTLIAYSTAPGQPASDDNEETHSIYTQALLELLPTPGLAVDRLFRKLTEEVFRRSDGRQKPEFVNGLMGDEVCLKANPNGLCQ